MWINLIEWFLFLSAIPVLEGSPKLMEGNEFPPIERTLKTMLESCYEDDASSNPILIFGDFNENIEKSSIIRMNGSMNMKNATEYDFKAKAIILITDSRKKLSSDLKFLWPTEWWDHMTPFFIIVKHKKACGNFKEILNTTWSKDMISSIYLCAESINSSVLYTLNLMANYAPYPWERVDGIDDFNVFRQVFNSKITCKNLNFDKTSILNEYEIKGVAQSDPHLPLFPEGSHKTYTTSNDPSEKHLELIVKMLNTSIRYEIYYGSPEPVYERIVSGTSDIMITGYDIKSSDPWPHFLYPHHHGRLIAVVKLQPEVTTLQKIYKLWSRPVLMAAALALTFLTLILTLRNRSLVVAMLDIVRLLTYTSIRTDVRTHSFRLYFTTMLIFVVISNGVFQGKIASFLTKQERGTVVGTMNELADLGYKMFTAGYYEDLFNKQCPKCNFKIAPHQECIEYVLNNTHHLCATWETEYYSLYSHLELDYVHDILYEDIAVHACRPHWPLKKRIDKGILRLSEAGIIDFHNHQQFFVQKQKRAAREAQWSSAQYRPVKLYKLMFAFQVLALGLILSAIAFIMELYGGGYEAA